MTALCRPRPASVTPGAAHPLAKPRAAKDETALPRAARHVSAHRAAKSARARWARPTPKRCPASGPTPTATHPEFGSRAEQGSIRLGMGKGAPPARASSQIAGKLRHGPVVVVFGIREIGPFGVDSAGFG